MWNFIPKIEIPIFNAGRNRANLDIAEIRQQQSVVNYEQKIQNAFKEVADALALRQSLNDQISAQQRYLASLQITLQRARALYQHGAVSYLEVLDAERSLFATRQTLLDLNYARQVNEISFLLAVDSNIPYFKLHVLRLRSLTPGGPGIHSLVAFLQLIIL